MIEAFPWHAIRARIAELVCAGPLRAEDGAFVRADLRLVPAGVLPEIVDGETPESWLARVPVEIGTQVVLLLRAGSAALGLWEGDACVAHKVFKRYVVRGHGKAQTLYQKTRGKSRYGSRLRLQNARKLLEEVDQRLGEWFTACRQIEAIHWSCPVRQWPELFATDPPPPFATDDARLRRIAMHVHEPDHEEMVRIRRRLGLCRIESTG